MIPVNVLKTLLKQSKRYLIAPSSYLLLMAAGIQPAAYADNQKEESDDPKRQKLQMIQVVGEATSGLDSVVTDEELEQAQAVDLVDIFRADPSVTAGGSIGMSQKIYVRGIGEDILNITVDGAEQANAVFHHSGRIALEPELLKQVEIEAGAGSATAGPGALGGSIRFTTKDPEDLLKEGQQFGAILKSAYFSNGEGTKNSISLFGEDSSERFGFLASVVQSDVENLEDGDGNNIFGSESEQELGFIKLVANISDNQYISLSHENIEEEGDIPYRPEWVVLTADGVEPTEGERKTTTLNYGFTPSDNDWVDLLVTLYNTEYLQKRFSSRFGVAYEGSVESKGLTLQNTSLVGNHELIYGINYRDDKSTQEDDPSTYEENENGEVKGIYLQDVINVTNQLTVSTGFRFDDYSIEDTNGDEFSDDGFSPNISANFAFNNQWSISAGYAEALRGVEVEDAFRLPSSDYTGLEAETAKNTELAVEFEQGGFHASVGVFETVIENAILRDPPWSSSLINLEDDIEVQGYTLNLEYEHDRLRASAKFVSADTEVGNQEASRYVYGSKATSIGDTLVIDLDYAISDNLQVGWVYEYVRSINDLDQTIVDGTDVYNLSIDKPSYDVHNIYVQWQPLGDDKFTVGLSVNNVFDEQYLSHANLEDYEDNAGWEGIVGSPEAGRDIRLGLTLRL